MASTAVTHLILGDGAAGMAAAQTIRMLAPEQRVLVVSSEARPFYFRAALTNYLLGRISEAELDALPPERSEALGIERVQDELLELRPADHRARLAATGWVTYRHLLIATGASARRLAPPTGPGDRGVPGADLEGLCVLRTLADANEVIERAERARHAVVLGGGILGLEAAQALREQGLHVSLVHRGATLMERVLDRTASDLVRQRVERDGVAVRLEAEAAAFHGGRGGVSRVELTDGARLPADLVVQALGNVPNTAPWIEGTGLAVKGGYVTVDRRMRAAGAPDVFAAGDVAAFVDASLPFQNPGGLWQPAVKQGIVAGRNMVSAAEGGRTPAPEYRPGAILNATRAWDLDVASLGDHVEGEGETVRHEQRRDDPPVYKRVLLREGRVAGALLLGDRREATALQTLMNLRGAAGDVRTVAEDLLRPTFDLFAWVDAQRRAPGVGRHDREVDLPQGARPRGLTQAPRGLTQRALGLTSDGRTAAFTSAPPPPLALHVDGRPRRVHAARLVLGGEPGADVPLSDPGVREASFAIERQGMVWMALTAPRAPVPLTRNGRAVLGRAPLAHGDVLAFGAHRIVVGLEEGAAPPPPPPAAAAEGAFLLGSRSRHDLRPPAMRVGRSPTCEIVIEHPTVSAHHADLRYDAGAQAWIVSQARHDRAVLVNGEPLSGARRLADKDVLTLGRARLTFGRSAPPPRPAEGAGAQTVAPRQDGWLLALRGPLAGGSFPLAPGTVVGRSEAASLRIDDVLLSGAHLRVEAAPAGGGALQVVDLGSTNGTRLAGERLAAGTPVALAEGALLEAGRHVFRFHREAPEGPRYDPSAQPREHAEGRTQVLGGTIWELEQAQEGGPAAAFPLGAEVVRVGRAPHNDLHLPQRDVSREHAEVRVAGGAPEVTDLDSRQGTLWNGQRLAPRVPQRLADGDTLVFGTRTFTVRRRGRAVEGASDPLRQRASLLPVVARMDLGPLPLPGLGPWIVGRQASSCAVVLPLETISRTHCEVVRRGERYAVRNLSANGTQVNGEPVPDDQHVPLEDGDVLTLQDVPLRFQVVREGGSSAPPPPSDRFGRGLSLAGRNPLEADLESVVQRELSACIGCHECMRACPLPDAATVTIGALNAYARDAAAGTPGVLRFVEDCTQCHRCVPVCPADIRRSRLVLWNKLRREPADDQVLTLQSGEEQTRSSLTVGHVAQQLLAHGLFGALGPSDVKRLVAGARLRQLEEGEVLFREGEFLDALWLVWEGSLAADVEVEARGGAREGARRSRRPVVPFGPGQTVGEAALLGDQPAEASVRARRRALVLGFTKYALTTARERQGNEAFDLALDSLYVGRSREGLVQRLGLTGEAAQALAASLRPHRHAAGQVILTRVEAADTLGFVARGYVREVRRGLARTRVANYLKAGDLFGGADLDTPEDVLIAYEAATQTDTFLLTRRQADDLERRFPGSAARLLPAAAADAGAPERRARDDGTFACPGGLGPLQAHELLVIDTRLCVDCDNCVSACERRHGRPRLERQNAGLQQGPYQVPASCYHCVDPLCLFCSVNGIVREPSGEIRIVEDNCIGCGQCAERCPYDNIFLVPRHLARESWLSTWVAQPLKRLFGVREGRWTLEPEEQVAVKCDLCAGYDDGPACVRSCPTGAARRDAPAVLFGVGRGEGA